VCTVIIAGIISVMAGYSFSRYRFKGRNLILTTILLLYLIPEVLLMIPLFTIFRQLRLLNKLSALVISYSTYAIPFSIWLLTGFINQIPKELDDASNIDGCNVAKTIVHVIVPLLRPGLVGSCSFIFITSWNEYIYAMLFTNQATQTVTVALASFVAHYKIRWDLITTGGIITFMPVVIIFMLVQKNLIAGLAAGSVKG
jgi:multiple sugar transport system permease protein